MWAGIEMRSRRNKSGFDSSKNVIGIGYAEGKRDRPVSLRGEGFMNFNSQGRCVN